MTLAVRAQGLTKIYRAGSKRAITAVDRLTLEIPLGEVFGYLGVNGAGKTTSVMMLLGCIAPTAGIAELFGVPISDPAARRRVGFLPEKFRFHEFLTAAELLRLHGRLAGMSSADCDRRIPEVLDMIGLAARADTPVREFSKGMQQRVGLGQALMPDPDLLILDEPTSALDPLGRREVRDLLMRLKEQGKTVFLNSHLLSEIELCCDRVAILHTGRLVRQGPIRELLAPSTRVEVHAEAVSPEALERLAGLGSAAPMPDRPDHYEIRVTDPADAPKIAAILVEGGASVHAIAPHRESLEEFFVRTVQENRA